MMDMEYLMRAIQFQEGTIFRDVQETHNHPEWGENPIDGHGLYMLLNPNPKNSCVESLDPDRFDSILGHCTFDFIPLDTIIGTKMEKSYRYIPYDGKLKPREDITLKFYRDEILKGTAYSLIIGSHLLRMHEYLDELQAIPSLRFHMKSRIVSCEKL